MHVENLHERLRRLKRRRGLSVKEIAAACGVSPQAVHGWLKDSIPKSESISKLSEIFEVPARWLMTGKNTQDREEMLAELNDLASCLSDEEIDAIITMARLLLRRPPSSSNRSDQ